MLAVLTAGCGGGSSTQDPVITQTTTDLTGLWETNCLVNANGDFYKQTIEITASKYITKTRSYLTNSCQTVLGLWEHNYNLTIGNVITTATGKKANNIDLEFINSFHTIKNQAAADFWNAQLGGFCGKNDWLLDIPFEVTANACDFEKATSGDILYNIVAKNTVPSPNTIQFGDKTLDLNNRPQILVSELFKKL